MCFDLTRSKYPQFDFTIEGEEIKKVKSQKFLRVIFDEKLSWKEHIQSTISKLNSCLGASRRARPFLNKSSLMMIYHSLMQSRVNYCCSTWAAWKPRGNQQSLQRLQAVCNKFFRLIFNLDYRDSVRSILKSNNILNIYQNYDFKVCLTMHKAVNGELPIPLKNILSTENNFFFFKKCRIKQTQKSASYSGPTIWNGLPSQLIEESDFKKFKSHLKQTLLDIE